MSLTPTGMICRLWWFRPSQSYVPSVGQSPKTQAIRLECSPFLHVGCMSGLFYFLRKGRADALVISRYF